MNARSRGKTGKTGKSAAAQTAPAGRWAGLLGSSWFLPVAVFTLALVLRLIYLRQIRYTPFFHTLGLDARYYDDWARRLAAGEGYGEPFFMSPLYPYFLAGMYRLFDRDLMVVRIVQSLLGAASASLVYMLARDLFDRRVALLAGFATACYGALIFYDGSIVMTSLLVFLNLLALFLLLRADRTDAPLAFAAAGVALGLAGVGRAAALLFVPLALWWIVSRPRRGRPLRGAVLFALGVLAVVATVTVRNYAVSGDFIPVTSNGGLNFYIGNSAIATGGYAKPDGVDPGGDVSGRLVAERDVGRSLKPSEVSSYWYARARDDIAKDPGRWLSLLARKLSFVMSSYELPQLENFEFQRRYSRLLSLPLPGFGLVAPLGLLGLGLAFRRRRARLLGLFLASYVVSIALFFVLARYRLPVVPVLAIGASYVVIDGYDRLRSGGARRIVRLVAVAAVLAFLVNANLYSIDRRKPFAQIHYRLGIVYGDRGDVGRAAAEYERAIEIDPSYPKSYLNLGALLARAGRFEEAAGVFGRALEVDSTYVAARVNLALVHMGEGRNDAALSELRRAISLDAGNAMAWTQLGVALYRSGRSEEALEALGEAQVLDVDGAERAEIEFYRALIERPPAGPMPAEAARAMAGADSLVQAGNPVAAAALLERAAALAPGSGAPLQQLSLLKRNMGLLDEAVGYLRRALEVEPSIPHGHFMLGVFMNESGQHYAAIMEYEAEIRLDPSYAPAHRNLATSYLYHLADHNRAAHHYGEYLRLGGAPVPPLADALRDISPEGR
ncbi:MAG: tetratricopeptide repeat protein [Candidatus Eisenbacteria bacterium]